MEPQAFDVLAYLVAGRPGLGQQVGYINRKELRAWSTVIGSETGSVTP